MPQQPQQRDVLNSNPDFELPGGARGGNGGRHGRSGSSAGQVPGGGRYPTGDL